MILTLSRKRLFAFLAAVLLTVSSLGVFFCVHAVGAKPNLQKVIVIDAGHGGQDGGAVGKQSGITESALNLEYSLYLKKLCQQFGFKVILTREDMGGLYSSFAKNKKRSEMQARKEIIQKAKPNLVVSIHMNSFPSSECRGAQVFYAVASEAGQKLAENVQASLHAQIEHAKKTVKVGDYYILNSVSAPSILIECGFLSNPEEEALLQEENYMHNFCYSVLYGILMYFDFQ